MVIFLRRLRLAFWEFGTDGLIVISPIAAGAVIFKTL